MKESILSIAALAASCALAGTYTHTTYTGSDTNLKSLAVVSDGKFVLGTGDYSDSEWGDTKERIYDGVTELQDGEKVVYRWFEPGWVNGDTGDTACNWAGYQTQSPVVVTHISFITRHDNYAERARGCRFEGANTADFSDAVALYTVPADADVETLKAGWVEVDVAGAALSSPFTYLRVVADDKYCGNFIEVEFYGKTWADATSGTPSAAPQNLTISSVDADMDAVTLTWDAPTEPCCSAKVIRSTAPGGSTFDVTLATLSATTLTYTDSDAARIPGVTYYYRVAFANEDNVGPASEAVSHRHVVQLERTSLSDTSLKSGMSAIFYDWDNETGALAFDGNVATFADINAHDGYKTNITIGVDLGAEYVVTGFKVYPRTHNNLGERANGAYLARSSDASDISNRSWAANPVALSPEMTGIAASEETWYTFSTTNRTPCRFIYLMKPTNPDFYGNVAELALYGYTLASSQSVLLAPENAAAEWHGTGAVITWTAGQNAASYQVERKADGGDWTVVAQGLTEQQYVDRPERPTKVGYIYRVASVDGNGGLAYTISITPTGTPAAPGLAITIR